MRAEVQYSILDKKFQEWFEDPGPGFIPLPETEAKHLRHRTRKRHAVVSTKLLGLLFLGFIGAASFGISVAISIYFMNLNIEGWYSDYWPSQSAVILIATVLGFSFGLFFEYAYQQRKRTF